jgi:hypothetical protein
VGGVVDDDRLTANRIDLDQFVVPADLDTVAGDHAFEFGGEFVDAVRFPRRATSRWSGLTCSA